MRNFINFDCILMRKMRSSCYFWKGKDLFLNKERLRSTAMGTKGKHHPSNKGGSSTDVSRCSNNKRETGLQLMTDDDNCRGVLCNSASMSFTRLSNRTRIYHSNSVYSKSIKGFRALPRPQPFDDPSAETHRFRFSTLAGIAVFSLFRE